MKKGLKVGFSTAISDNIRNREAKSSKRTTQNDPFEGRQYYLLRNFGVEKKIIFSSQEDYDRFEAYLYLLNAVESPRASNFFLDGRNADPFMAARGEKLVAIGAYSFTQREFNILATPLVEKGIARFMQKLQTAYTMYFNKKYMRSGRLFHGAYSSSNAQTDNDLKYYFALVHLSPAQLFSDEWESSQSAELFALASNAVKYRYSSAGEYVTKKNIITSPEIFPRYALHMGSVEKLVRAWKRGK